MRSTHCRIEHNVSFRSQHRTNPRMGLCSARWHDGQIGRVRAFEDLTSVHDLVPKAVRIAVLVNPANVLTTETTLREIPEAARSLGLQFQVLNASTSREIEEAFAILARERTDALFVAPDSFFQSRRVQFATLTTRHAIPVG